ncbi:class I mannose-6-phosphate isomerase [Sphingobium yanoikuyae]|uniref:class I mannose-6-phosphate isomerase n=1 Tax=Sphingobium yanoikuyae TaxID=13690 RepID=UPI000262B885|nr:class I mannose-6-phosphate isomerase [Sphingobium yanoikuyae]
MTARLPVRQVEKPWGKKSLPPVFGDTGGRQIGEIWFEPPAEIPDLLVKYIFTSEKLSVQVHPSDTQTIAAGLGKQGKEECWLVIDAEPGATLGIGFDQDAGTEQLHAAALDGSIETMMTWHPVTAGDFFYIPANTVHAIGAGISLIEVQQNSDITYRLFDYGRPRELHLEEGLAVSRGEIYDLSLSRRVAGGTTTLVNGPYFRMDQLCGAVDTDVRHRYGGAPLLVIPRKGDIRVGGERVEPGQCAHITSIDDLDIDGNGISILAQSTG